MKLKRSNSTREVTSFHTCGGAARLVLFADESYWCIECSAPALPEQPYRQGHAGFACGACGHVIGLCGAGAVDQLHAEAGQVVARAGGEGAS